jgi:hypothetical protein
MSGGSNYMVTGSQGYMQEAISNHEEGMKPLPKTTTKLSQLSFSAVMCGM